MSTKNHPTPISPTFDLGRKLAKALLIQKMFEMEVFLLGGSPGPQKS